MELGYPLSHPKSVSERRLTVGMLRLEYANFYEFKQWAKVNTPLSRWLVNYSATLIDK